MHSARLFKFVFIFIAAGLTFFLLSQNNEQLEIVDIPTTTPINKPLKKTSVEDVSSTIMQAPRFSGEDNKNHKWLITAKTAVQSNEKVVLDTVKAKITNAENEKLLVTATEGIFKHQEKSIKLQKGLEINGYGFNIKTQEVTALLKQGYVSGNSFVTVKTAQGNLTAENFIIQENGEKIVFSGGVNAVFNIKGQK